MAADEFVIGVDVGTTSARAGLFTSAGRLLASHVEPIKIFRTEGHPDNYEQSSEDIWAQICACVRAVVRDAGVAPEQIKGLGFDATCSLVALDSGDGPVSLSLCGDPQRNVILWMDHRATAQSERINAGGHAVLKYVGGALSPEMETPKMCWVKENLPQQWARVDKWMDLADFCSYKATASEARSLCTTVCKWTYQGHEEEGWDGGYFEAIGLGDLARDGFRRIGKVVRPLGEPLGAGLSAAAAADLGLPPGVAVAVGAIDAHVGGIGVIGAPLEGRAPTQEELETRLVLVCGTSSCHMAVSRAPKYVPRIWGPYFSAMVPGMWLTEGGQSATGGLIDHVLESHAASRELREAAAARSTSVYAVLEGRLEALAAREARCGGSVHLLTRELHVFPDFHGNRSPRADASLKGMLSGLTLGRSLDDLALLYLATLQACALETRHILDAMNAAGHRLSQVFMCGGLTKSPLFVAAHANAARCRVVLPREADAVLLGGAMLGASAAGLHGPGGLLASMGAMGGAGAVVEPDPSPALRAFYEAKYKVYEAMYEHQMEYRRIMSAAP
eukprot:tig00001471_g8873.t1